MTLPVAIDWFSPSGYLPNCLDPAHLLDFESCTSLVWKAREGVPFVKYRRTKLIEMVPDGFELVRTGKIYDSSEPWVYLVNPVRSAKVWFADPFLANISPQALEGIREHNGFLLLMEPEEASAPDDFLFQNLYDAIARNGIPLAKVIWVTNNYLLPGRYLAWCSKKGVTDEIRIKVIEYLEALTAARLREVEEDEDALVTRRMFHSLSGRRRDKAYLCLNHKHRQHRLLAALYLKKNVLLRRGLVRFAAVDETFPAGVDRPELMEVYEEFKKSLPLRLDGPPKNPYRGASWLYSRTYFSLITETTIESGIKLISEKTFKAMANYHPFIVLGSQGTIRKLTERGYKGFDIDASYDDISDPDQRVWAALETMQALLRRHNQDRLHEWYWDQQDTLAHNRELFFSHVGDLDALPETIAEALISSEDLDL